jgi:SAM-dependent methyltransferase
MAAPEEINADMLAFWNGEGGDIWVARQEYTDITLAPVTGALLTFAAPRAGERVVDIGCGCGAPTLEFARAVAPSGRVAGLDISGPMLAEGERRASAAAIANVDWRQVDPATAALDEYDLLISAFGVMFFGDRVAAFTNMRRAAAPDARMALVCWRTLAENPWMEVPMTAAAQHLPPRAHPGQSAGEATGERPISLFILGPSGSGKSSVEKLVGMLPAVKRGYENPIVENVVRWTFQAGNLPTLSSLGHLPAQLFPLFRKIYQEELARRIGSAEVFTNTLPTYIHDAVRLASFIPGARFIFVKRNIEDNLLRIFIRKYRDGNPYGYNLKAAREHILWYHQMIDVMAERFAKIVRVISYEDMVLNPAETLCIAAELCGIPSWSGQFPAVAGDVGCARPYQQFISDGLNLEH